MPLPPASDTLGGDSEALPDLLAGEIPENVNPTEIVKPEVDALGNPVGASVDTPKEPSPLPSVSTQQPTTTSGPRTITIDGAPIDGSGSALIPAPISGLTKVSAYGRIPAISASGLTPLSAYKRPFSAVSGKQTVADFNPAEPGADRALMASRNAAANMRNLDWLLSRGQGYFGVTNYNGDRFLTRADVAAPILDKLAKSGLSFVFDGSVSAPSLSALSSSARLPFARGYNLIDPQQDTSIIQSELSRLNAQAQNSSGTIGVGFAYPETIAAVRNWAQGLGSQGLTLAPASTTLR